MAIEYPPLPTDGDVAQDDALFGSLLPGITAPPPAPLGGEISAFDTGSPPSLELPQSVVPEEQESPLDVYLREKKEREDAAAKIAEEQNRRQQSTLTYLQTKVDTPLVGPIQDPEKAQEELENFNIAEELKVKARAEEFDKDFGWLGGEKLPGWTTYKEQQLGNRWETLTPQQKAKAFDYYSDRARAYYSTYGDTPVEKVNSGLDEVLVGNFDIVDAKVATIQEGLDKAGYGRGWKDATFRGLDTATLGLLPVKGSPGYESTSSSLAGAEALRQAQKMSETLKYLNTWDKVINPDGTINPERYQNAVKLANQALNEDIAGAADLMDPLELMNPAQVQEAQSQQAAIAELGQDPAAKIRTALEAVRGYSQIGRLEMAKANPELAEALSGKRIVPTPYGKTGEVLPEGERIKKVLTNPVDFATFTMGMALAQQADLLEENIAGTLASIATGGPAVGLTVSAMAGGQQEATLVAADIVQDGMTKAGLDPFSQTDWLRATENGVMSEIAQKAEQQGQTKGLSTAAVESGLENIASVILKRFPVGGQAASGLLRMAGRGATKAGAAGLAGFTSAAVGEAAGQRLAYGTTDLAEIFIEGAGEVAGTGTIRAQKSGLAAAGRLVTGRPVIPQPQTKPQPTTTTTTRGTQPTEADEETEIRGTTPKSDTPDAQETSTEVPTESRNVETPSPPNVGEQVTDDLAARTVSIGRIASQLNDMGTPAGDVLSDYLWEEKMIVLPGPIEEKAKSVKTAIDELKVEGITDPTPAEISARVILFDLAKREFDATQEQEAAQVRAEQAQAQELRLRQSPRGRDALRASLEAQATKPESAVVQPEVQAAVASAPEKQETIIALADALAVETPTPSPSDQQQAGSGDTDTSVSDAETGSTAQQGLQEVATEGQAVKEEKAPVSRTQFIEEAKSFFTNRDTIDEEAELARISGEYGFSDPQNAFNALEKAYLGFKDRQPAKVQAAAAAAQPEVVVPEPAPEPEPTLAIGSTQTFKKSEWNEMEEVSAPTKTQAQIRMDNDGSLWQWESSGKRVTAKLVSGEVLKTPDKSGEKVSTSKLQELETEFQAADDAYQEAKEGYDKGMVTDEDFDFYLDARNEAAAALTKAKAQANSLAQKRKRKNQGGFLDVGLVIDGLEEVAVQAWSTAKTFGKWAAIMLKQFGEQVRPVLRQLWNRISAIAGKAYDYIVDPVLPGRNTERGSVGINVNPEDYPNYLGVGKIFRVSIQDDQGGKLTFLARPGKDSTINGVPVKIYTELSKDGNPLHDTKDGKVAERTRIVQSSFVKKEEAMGRSKMYGDLQVLRPKNMGQLGAISFGGTRKPSPLRTAFDQTVKAAGVKQGGSIDELAKSINLTYLPGPDRKKLQADINAIVKEFDDARRIKVDPNKSKAIFDKAMDTLRQAKIASWTAEFKSLKNQYPASLASKNEADFTSGKEARAWVATQGVSTEVSAEKSRAVSVRAGLATSMENRQKRSKASADHAKTQIPLVLDTPEYNGLNADQKRQVRKALKYLQGRDTEQNTEAQNEALIAGVVNFLDGNFMGGGLLASKQRVIEFALELDQIMEKYGGRIPFFDRSEAIGFFEGIITGDKSKNLFKKEARLRAAGLSHPELKELWDKHFGNYLEKSQTDSSRMQQEKDEAIFETLKKYGLAKPKVLGRLRAGEFSSFNNREVQAMRRMAVAAQITTWRKSSENPLYDIESIINDLQTSLETERKGTFLGTQGEANTATFLQFINPAIEDGMITETENGYQILTTPDEWHDYIMSKLDDNERKALVELRQLAGEFEPSLKFNSEFYYGKQWDPWQNYMPRTVYSTKEDATPGQPDLTQTTATPAPDGTALQTHGSVLHPRQRLGKGQYYGMNLASVLHNSLNTAAYEIATAESRFAINEGLKDKSVLAFFGGNENRLARFHSTLKDIHQAELHQGTGTKQPNTIPGAFAQNILNTASNVWMSLALARIHQFPAQFISPIVGSFTMVGPKMFNYASQWYNEWSKEQVDKLYAASFPDLLQRIEQIDPFYDRAASKKITDAIADISLGTDFAEFTNKQKALVYASRVNKAVTAALEGAPKYIARRVTQEADYWAVRQWVFPVMLQDALIRRGIISKPDEFTPATIDTITSNPQYAAALAEAKTKTSDVMGVANRFSMRPNVFVFPGDQTWWQKSIMALMQTATQYAGDRFVDFKDMSYRNKKDPYAKGIQNDAYKRVSSAILQGIVFKFIAGWVGHNILGLLVGAFSKAQGMDDEEKLAADKLNKLGDEMLTGNTGTQALKEVAQMLLGPQMTNSIAGTGIDMAYSNAIIALTKEKIDARKEELNKQIKAEKNTSRKADLQMELDRLIKRQSLLNLKAKIGPDVLGLVPAEVLRVVNSNNVSDSEADQIANEYFKRGGPIKKPDRNVLGQLALNVGGALSGDIRAAERRLDKVRSEVARKRQEQIEDQDKNNKRRVDAISIQSIR